MEIERASEMGFCFGVRRAIEMVERVAREQGTLQSLGGLVHNRQVITLLAERGVSVAESMDEIQGKVVAVASHGVSSEIMGQLKSRGLQVIDATCPFVRKAQVVAQKLARDGFEVLVFGDASHPEVQGVLGWAGGKASASLEVPRRLPRRLGILAQTTQSQAHFANFVAEIISSNHARVTELRVFNTLCDATRKQQAAALELARRVDLMVVIGGRNSANTRRLAEICAATGVTTYHIETAVEIDPSWFQGRHRVGVTAGASTPGAVIDEVVLKLEETAREMKL